MPGTELFALDINLVVQLLSSFEGTIVYPKTEKKEAIFETATEKVVKQSEPSGKKSRWRFSDVGIPIGAELTFIHNKSIKVYVADDTHVEYNGEVWSMSKLAQVLKKRNSATQGTLHFAYKGKRLTDLRDELENQ